MKILIFAGGAGRRLWPISRQKSPKQFEPIIGPNSTLQLAVDRVLHKYGAANIYVSTNEAYVPMVQQQLPQLPPGNIIGEPARRDLAAAVGLALAHLAHDEPPDQVRREPVAILWGDNYMDQVSSFLTLMSTAEALLLDEQADILFIGETPRFPNQHLGWLGIGEKVGAHEGQPYYRFKSLTYRPSLELCREMFARKTHVWNTGYFVTRLGFVQDLYRRHQPDMAEQLARVASAIGTDQYRQRLHQIYPGLDAMSFDDAILYHIEAEQALVLHGEMGWSDPGTLYALKEAIDPEVSANVKKGLVLDHQSADCLLYNYQSDKLVVALGLEGIILVNTEDALLVVHKDHIAEVKNVINGFDGTDLEPYS